MMQHSLYKLFNSSIIIIAYSPMNPQVTFPQFYDDYCEIHPEQVLSIICLDEDCESYLNIQCKKCHHAQKPTQEKQEESQTKKSLYHKHTHSHCHQLDNYLVNSLYPSVLKNMTLQIRRRVGILKSRVDSLFEKINSLIERQWYACVPKSCTRKECINILQIPNKVSKIEQTARIKDEIISYEIGILVKKFQKQFEVLSNKLSREMNELTFRQAPEKWKFDPHATNALLNISPSQRTVDKKSEIPKFCLSLLNQPITPFKNQATFIINSQNIYSKYIIIGLCDPNKAFKNNYELPLLSFEPSSPTHPSNKRKGSEEQNSLTLSSENIGLYGIYQASNYTSTNNALSIHSNNPSLNYKEIVGWNFGSGDTISVGIGLEEQFSEHLISEKGSRLKEVRKAHIWFRKNAMKQKFELQIDLSCGFLYPFVALYAPGDKVTVDLN